MAYDEDNFEESLGGFVLAVVIVIMLILAFGAYLVLGPGRIERRDTRTGGVYRAWEYLHRSQTRDLRPLVSALVDEPEEPIEKRDGWPSYCESIGRIHRGRVEPLECEAWALSMFGNDPERLKAARLGMQGWVTRSAPSAPPPCTKDGPLAGGEAWTCGEPPNRSRHLVFNSAPVPCTPDACPRTELPTLGGTAMEAAP